RARARRGGWALGAGDRRAREHHHRRPRRLRAACRPLRLLRALRRRAGARAERGARRGSPLNLACGAVGAGAIRRGFAASPARAGFVVEVVDIEPEAAAATGVPVAESLEALASNADVVLLALPDTPQIEEALAGGLEQGLRPGSVLIVTSTVSPDTPVELER